ncbi:hypothetical protein B0H16DRAFT_1448280 [Mycena metata]|uniref:Transmembrane protein n=1 Tax=Mycena metata TaxID=1033252 RepID=A0AAD7KBT2_9AGAR|nr:hypothetical protein B0H16DRAFT_1448280 [Mycena metata]
MSLLSPNGNPNFVQGSASTCPFVGRLSLPDDANWKVAAVTWVMYDVCLTWDRELLSVWSRYHTILALGFFLVEATLQSKPPSASPTFIAAAVSLTSLQYSYVSRWYLGLTEVLSIMSGQFMILIRINAVYGWSRRAESVIGFTTTIISIRGGAKGLFNSTEILTCSAGQGYIPDVNVSMWCTSMVVVGIYFILVVHKAKDIAHVIDGAESQLTMKKVGHLLAFQTTNMTPTLRVCLRDAAIYFGVVFGVLLINLVLVLLRNRNAYMGTAWLLATYSVASTRISLNLKDLSVGARYNESSWSKFQENSALEFSEMQPVTRTVDAERPSEPPEAHVRARIST